jgi:hypothetical protein
MTRLLARLTPTVVALVGLLAATACSNSGNGPTATGRSPNSPSPQVSVQTGGSSPSVQPSSVAVSTSPPDTRPIIGDLVAAAQNVQCSYVPNGNIDGSDGLTVFMYIYLTGAGSLPGPMQTAISFSNGYTATSTGFPSGSAYQPVQGPIRVSDWGHILTVRITVDPADHYRESNESNNAISVAVNLPPTRPATTVDPLPCNATSA